VIAVDTSALMAMILDEPWADDVQRVLEDNMDFCISAATLVEAHIVSRRRNVGAEMDTLLSDIAALVEPVTQSFAQAANAAHNRYGKGVHPAGLNFGDCFAYALAKSRSCPLLYVGDDFAQTDIRSAL
jgi:ribonuclease VapC